MSEGMYSEELRQVGGNCSRYLPDRRGVVSMYVCDDNEVSCATCRNWSGKRCVIDAYDNVAVNMGIIPEE
jgi:hypothetical protein